MPEQWTCNDCGSKTTTRRRDVTSAADQVKQYLTVPYACSNSNCLNSSPRNHSLSWCSAV